MLGKIFPPTDLFWPIIAETSKVEMNMKNESSVVDPPASNITQGPVVYVTQIPNRRDKDTKQLVSVINIAPATQHGEVRVIMPPNASINASADIVRTMRQALRDYNFLRGDSIVMLGDPAIIAVAAAILGEGRRFRVLKWDRLVSRYLPVEISI